jgi:hypothetical protein
MMKALEQTNEAAPPIFEIASDKGRVGQFPTGLRVPTRPRDGPWNAASQPWPWRAGRPGAEALEEVFSLDPPTGNELHVLAEKAWALKTVEMIGREHIFGVVAVS